MAVRACPVMALSGPRGSNSRKTVSDWRSSVCGFPPWGTRAQPWSQELYPGGRALCFQREEEAGGSVFLFEKINGSGGRGQHLYPTNIPQAAEDEEQINAAPLQSQGQCGRR